MESKQLGKTGIKIPVLGQGAWGIGGFSTRSTSSDREEVEALRKGIELGLTHIDTAEAYSAGHSEELVGEAIKEQKDKVFLATKVSPQNFRYDDVLKAAERSLRRLGLDCIDLYQLHWPSSSIPLAETMRAMEKLVSDGKVRYIGVSNFSVEQTKEAQESLAKNEIVSNQVEYNLLSREVEDRIMPFCEKEKITVIAYSPLARGRIADADVKRKLESISVKYSKTPVQVALNWLVSKKQVIAIPKASRITHLQEIVGAAGWNLNPGDLNLIDKEFS